MNLTKNSLNKNHSSQINEEIAELCGIILGDGNLHKFCNRITICGGLKDAKYHQKIVTSLFVNNFDIIPISFIQKSKNAHYLQVESKKVFDFFLRIGLKRGAKINICIPEIIMNNRHLATHFLRGLFDTDSCIKFSKQGRSVSYYPRIRISAKESPMAKEIGILLKKIDFNYSIWKDKRAKNIIFNYEISGKENAKRWFSLIKPKNPVKEDKYSVWLKDGQYNPEFKGNDG